MRSPSPAAEFTEQVLVRIAVMGWWTAPLG